MSADTAKLIAQARSTTSSWADPDDSNDVQLWARAALAAVPPPEAVKP